jgi:kynurenine formamidase
VPLPQEFQDLAKKVNNWGRWGKADEIGTINLITPEVVRKGAACIRGGRCFSLAIPLGQNGPQVGQVPGRVNPLRTMVAINDPMTPDTTDSRSSDDVVTMGLQAGTHWDSLAHVSYDDRLYNGFPASTITARGAAHCGIDKIKTIAGRGVLLDVARAQGRDRLEPGYALRPEDLDAACELAKANVEPGDIVLLRTGQIQLLHQGDKIGYTVPNPGPSMMTVEWFHDHDVAAVATDSYTFEVYPCEREDIVLPVHLLHLVDMGMTQGQNFDLEALAADCADDGVYQFFLDASPEPFEGGVGTPVNPVAIK